MKIFVGTVKVGPQGLLLRDESLMPQNPLANNKAHKSGFSSQLETVLGHNDIFPRMKNGYKNLDGWADLTQQHALRFSFAKKNRV